MTTNEKLNTLRRTVWNGAPIRYEVRDVQSLDKKFTTFILCIDYVDARDNFPRYAAVQNEQIAAVSVSQSSGFANMVVDPLFRGSLCLLAPYYTQERGFLEYVVPVVEEERNVWND